MTTAACPRTLYAPNPPQLDEPWLKIAAALALAAVVLITAVALGS